MSKKVLLFLAVFTIFPVLAACDKKDAATTAKAEPSASGKTLIVPTASAKADPSPNASLAVDTPPHASADHEPAPADTADKADKPLAVASGAASGTTTAAHVDTAPSVKLISAGNDPKSPLRFHVAKGASQSVVMTMIMGIGAQGKQMKLPAMKIGLTLHVTDVLPNGNIKYDYKMDNVEVADDGSVPAEQLTQMKTMFKELEKVKGHMVVTDRGFVKETNVEVPETVNPQVRQVLDSMKQSMSQVVAQYPEEAVGQGAKWQAVSTVSQNGMTLTQKADYELVSRTGDVGKTKVTITQTAGKQQIHAPGMPEGMKMELTSLNTTGGGTNDFDLTKLSATHSDLKMTTNMTMSADGKSMPISMDIQVKLTPR